MCLAMAAPAEAADIKKCTVNGEVIYSDTACGHQGEKKGTTNASGPAGQATAANNPAAQKHFDAAAVLRASAQAKSVCQRHYITATGYDRLAIKYPEDAGFRAMATAEWNKYGARCK